MDYIRVFFKIYYRFDSHLSALIDNHLIMSVFIFQIFLISSCLSIISETKLMRNFQHVLFVLFFPFVSFFLLLQIEIEREMWTFTSAHTCMKTFFTFLHFYLVKRIYL